MPSATQPESAPAKPRPEPAAPISGYRPELDAVRFLAFLLVFCHHAFIPDVYRKIPASVLNLLGHDGLNVVAAMANACAMGLCLFFCLSAYLITELLLRERDKFNAVSVRNFYVRRILRIWPLYAFGLLLGVAWGFIDHQRNDLPRLAWYLLFAGNFYCAAFGWSRNPFTPLWTISIEEQFYIVWPWAMRWFSRLGLLAAALVFILVANTALFIFGRGHASTDTTIWANSFVQFEMFAVGILLALAARPAVGKSAVTGLGLAFCGPVLWFIACYIFHAKQRDGGLATSASDLMLGFACIALGCAAVLQGFCILGPARMPKWVVGLGKISYGLYVYHEMAMRLCITLFVVLHFRYPQEESTPLALLVTILFAKVSYARLETPFLRLKRRFEAVHSRPI
jgi:peptidoglycan/LPS O-acetylase OafA/YrhL